MGTLNSGQGPGASGPADQGPGVAQRDGDAVAGKEVFRFETFGNEGFWTDALGLPRGMAAAQVTPMQALELGLDVDVLKVPPDIAVRVQADLARDPMLHNSEVMHDAAITMRLINAHAMIGSTCVERSTCGTEGMAQTASS